MHFRPYIQREYLAWTGLVCVFFLVSIASGCGKKLFPSPDAEVPAPKVQDLTAQILPGRVELSWTAVVPTGEGEAAYRFAVTRSELGWENRNCLSCPGAGEQEILVVDPNRPAGVVVSGNRFTLIDPAVAVHHAYRYRISVRDNKGRHISYSNVALAKVFPGPPPPVSAGAITQPQGILVQWRPTRKDPEGRSIQGEVQFQVERLSAKSVWEKVSSLPVKGNSYLDQNIAGDQAYTYRVVPVLMIENSSVTGEPSQQILAKAPGALPPPPPATVWVIPSKGTLEIRWSESEGKVSGYHVYRREGKEITRLTASPVQQPPFMDRSVKRNAIYYYAVSSVSNSPESREGLLSKWVEIRSVLME